MTMTKLLRMVVVLGLTLSLASLYLFHIGQVGSTASWSNGNAQIRAGTHPIMVVWAVLGICLFGLLMWRKECLEVAGVPGWSRRIIAFLIDFYFGLITLSGLGALIPLLLEAVRTGQFAWTFQRRYAVNTDIIVSLPLVLVSMGLFVLYFAVPLTRGRQTVGCFVMRTKVTPPFGTEGRFTLRGALRRTWFEFRGLCQGTSLFRPARDSQGRTWYDTETNCVVVLVQHK
jgi:uncharacterized RDD family membrane protein YckC